MNNTKKVIVHMGFHKTGTTSLQAYLQTYRKDLKPFADIYMKKQLGTASSAGRFYGQRPWYGQQLLFRRAFRKFLQTVSDAPVIVISRETFVGIMPGHRRLGFIRAKAVGKTASVLAQEVTRGLRQRFGQDAEIILLYTTREKLSWLKSVWGHVVRSIDLTQDREAFVAELSDMNSLEDEVAIIAKNVPDAKVMWRSLDELKTQPTGPATAVLDLLNLPQGFVEKHPVKSVNNVAETYEMQLQFLELNRTMKDKSALAIEKAKLADELRTARGLNPVFERRVKF